MRIKSWTHSNCCLHFYMIAYLHLKVNAFCDSEGEGQRQDKLHVVKWNLFEKKNTCCINNSCFTYSLAYESQRHTCLHLQGKGGQIKKVVIKVNSIRKIILVI